MSSALLYAGVMTCAAAAATGLAARGLGLRTRLLLLAAAMLLGPILIAADSWDSERVRELRESPPLLAAATVAGAAILAALVALFRRRPLILPLAAIATMPFRIPVELGDQSANLLLPLYAVLAAGVIAAILEPERILPRSEPRRGAASLLAPALAAVIVVYAIQSAYADDASGAVESIGFFFAPFAALFVLLARAPWDRSLVRLALIVLVVEGLVVAAVAFGQYATRELFWNEKLIAGNEAHAYFRVNSLFFDPNIMGRYLALTMVALAGVVAWGSRRDGRISAALFVVLLAALAISFSQSSMLALLAGVLVVIAARIGIAAGLLAGAATVIALAATLVGFGSAGITDETTGRTGLVSGGLELVEQQPIVGNGSGSFPSEFEARFGGGDGIATESHTEPVTVLAEQGAVGMVPYLLLLGVAIATLWIGAGLRLAGASNPLGATLLAMFAAMVVHSLGYAAFFTDPITWSLLALAVALPATRAVVEKPATVRAEPQPA